jgi:hypothetical protein
MVTPLIKNDDLKDNYGPFYGVPIQKSGECHE